MIIKLPINLQASVITECWTFYRMSIIDSYENLVNWRLCNINKLIMNHDDSIYFGEENKYYNQYKCYDGALRFSVVHDNNNADSIIDCITAQITAGKYVLLDVDYSLIDINSQMIDNISNPIHETLVFGADTDKKTFYIPSLHNEKWHEKEIPMKILAEAYLSMKTKKTDIQDFFNYQFMSIEVESRKYELPGLQYFYNFEFLRYKTKDNQDDFNNYYFENSFGLIYSRIIDILSKGNKLYNTKMATNLAKMIECKKILLKQIHYINNRFNINISELIIEGINNIIYNLQLSVRLYIKYSINYNDAILSQIVEYISAAYDIEIKIMDSLRDTLSNYLKKNLICAI